MGIGRGEWETGQSEANADRDAVKSYLEFLAFLEAREGNGFCSVLRTVYGAYHVSRITYEARDLVFGRLVEMKLAFPQTSHVPRGTPWGGQPKWNPCRGGGLIFSHWQNTHTHLTLIIIRIDRLPGQERRVDRVGQRISHSGEEHFSSSMGNNNVNNTKSRLARSAHVAVLPVVACLSLFFGQATARNPVDTCVDWLIG
jgi:hypothetical protein